MARRLSLGRYTKRLMRAFMKFGMATGMTSVVVALKNALGTITIDVLGTTVDLTIIPVVIATGFGILLMISAIRDLGITI